jgi:paraquat-inducible protein B
MEIIKNKTLPVIDRAIDSGNRLLNQSSDSVTLFRKETLPGLNKILGETEKAIEEARRNYLEHNSPTNRELIKMFDDISRMSRSIKELTDYLQRHPESIIRGK